MHPPIRRHPLRRDSAGASGRPWASFGASVSRQTRTTSRGGRACPSAGRCLRASARRSWQEPEDALLSTPTHFGMPACHPQALPGDLVCARAPGVLRAERARAPAKGDVARESLGHLLDLVCRRIYGSIGRRPVPPGAQTRATSAPRLHGTPECSYSRQVRSICPGVSRPNHQLPRKRDRHQARGTDQLRRRGGHPMSRSTPDRAVCQDHHTTAVARSWSLAPRSGVSPSGGTNVVHGRVCRERLL